MTKAYTTRDTWTKICNGEPIGKEKAQKAYSDLNTMYTLVSEFPGCELLAVEMLKLRSTIESQMDLSW